MSIQRRLLWLLGLSLPLLWFTISLLAAMPLYRQINADDDENLRYAAKWLIDNYHAERSLQTDITPEMSPTISPEISPAIPTLSPDNPLPIFDDIQQNQLLKDMVLELEADFGDDVGDDFNNAFQTLVWDKNGVVVAGTYRDFFAKRPPSVGGFVDSGSRWQSDSWRVFYHHDPRSGITVAVAQAWQERLGMMWDSIIEQMLILLLSLPILLMVVLWAVQRGLRPVRKLSTTLHTRHAHDLTPITHVVPKELQPLTDALNQLFSRVTQTIAREQRFTADAAHELRSPLTAIKVQADNLTHVIPNDASNSEAHQHLSRIQSVVGRSAHLIEQLLVLAGLDHADSTDDYRRVDWLSISDNALQSVNLAAREKGIRLRREMLADSDADVLPINGSATLLSLLLRNLLDNAVAYSDENSEVTLSLHADAVRIRDTGKGIAPAYLPRIGERFFRPPGQSQNGSGLGLSIVKRIAELHGLQFHLSNHEDGGAVAEIRQLS